MIVNEFHDGQGLGNQLWNYALARIISKKSGCDFFILNNSSFKGKSFMEIDFGRSPDSETLSSMTKYSERIEYLSGTDIDISRTDPKLLDIHAKTIFEGNCQSTKYLAGQRENLLGWIKIKDEYKKYSTGKDACVIHLRCGDFKKIKDVFLPAQYYTHAMDHIKKLNPNIKFYCVTDEKDEAEKILPGVEVIGSALQIDEDTDKASHHKGGPVGIDFALIMNAKYLIIPNSSFSWWAAYLNTHKAIVIAPKFWARHNISKGYWSTSDIITDGFTYLDKSGKAFTSEQCWLEKEIYEANHPEIFSQEKMLTLLQKTKNIIRNLIHPAQKKSSSRGKVYDIFTFFNELELLQIRLNVLDKHVDHFVLIESTETFSGKPKELFYEKNKHLFNKWKDKIIHHIIDDVPKDQEDLRLRLKNPSLSILDKDIIQNSLTSDNIPKGQVHWFKEFYQKESIKKALIELSPDDICFVSDVDEIWNPKRDFNPQDSEVLRIRQDMYAYYINNRSSEPWAGTLVTRYQTIRDSCLNHLRTPRKTKYRYVNDGGWHFTNMGGVDRIKQKLESYGHQEFNNDTIKSDLERKISENKDFIGRKFRFWIDEKGLPEYIISNKDKYIELFKKNDTN